MKQALSPKDLALAVGVSESSLKRWSDEGHIRATRTAGGHRRIPVAEAIRFVRESRLQVIRPDLLGLPDIEAVAGEMPATDDEADRLLAFLREGRARKARGFVLSLYLSGRSVAEICDGPIRQAMTALGELWKHGSEGIFIEHRATDICTQMINQLRLLLNVTSDAPVAVGGAPADDLYFLPSLAAATVLTSVGYRTVNLGPNVPAEAFLHAARHYDARLIWVSVSGEVDRALVRREIEAIVTGLKETSASLMLGGQRLAQIPIPDDLGLHVGNSMTELAAFARGLLQATHLQPAPTIGSGSNGT